MTVNSSESEMPLAIVTNGKSWQSFPDMVDRPVLMIANITKYMAVESELMSWCKVHQIRQVGMLLVFPDEQILSLFILRWMH